MMMKNRQLHGITSLGLVAISVLIAIAVIFWMSWPWGIGYLLITAAAIITILYAFCAKCPCRHHCGHVLPGKAASRFSRPPGPYNLMELSAVMVSLLLLLGLPQFWLWLVPGWFIVFWILNLTALTQIRSAVCKECDNIYCPVNRRKV